MLPHKYPVSLCLALFALTTPQTLRAQPSQVSYQGELKKDGLPFTGVATMKFAILDGSGESLWSNDATSVTGTEPTDFVSIDAANGIFAIRLGAPPMAPISGASLKGVMQVALRVWVNTGDGFEQLTDQPISSSAFSLSGEKCLEIGDLQINVVPRWDGQALVPGALFDDGANVGVGTNTPTTKLDVSGTVRSSSGGFQFPDGSTQTTAVTGGGGGVPSGAMILTTTPAAPDGYTSTGIGVSAVGSNAWYFRKSMLEARGNFGLTVLDGKIYAFGGDYSPSTVEVYDPMEDLWIAKTPMPIGRFRLTAAAANGRIFVVGGLDAASHVIAEVDAYDPSSDSWAVVSGCAPLCL